MRHRLHPTPAGDLLVVMEDEVLTGLWPVEQAHFPDDPGAKDDSAGEAVVTQLDEYFSGERRVFDLPLLLRGTSFQRAVWEVMLEIPYAHTCSYGELATAMGRPTASRAVGRAAGCNPISIIVPSHRVVGASGFLVAHAPGAKTKQFLLDRERSLLTKK